MIIDDQNIVVEEFGPGSRYNINKEEEKIEIVKELVESDVEVRGDKRTFKIMREVGDSLEGMIRLTADYPSNHPGCHWLISMFRLVCCCRYCAGFPNCRSSDQCVVAVIAYCFPGCRCFPVLFRTIPPFCLSHFCLIPKFD